MEASILDSLVEPKKQCIRCLRCPLCVFSKELQVGALWLAVDHGLIPMPPGKLLFSSGTGGHERMCLGFV